MHLCPTKKKWNICLEMEKCKLAPITGLKVSSSSMMKPLLNQSRRESTLPYLCKEDTSGVVVFSTRSIFWEGCRAMPKVEIV